MNWKDSSTLGACSTRFCRAMRLSGLGCFDEMSREPIWQSYGVACVRDGSIIQSVDRHFNWSLLLSWHIRSTTRWMLAAMGALRSV